MRRTNQTRQYLKARGKSYAAAGILAFLFGPLGLIYAAPIAGLCLSVVALATAFTFFIPVAVWLVSIPLAFIAVANFNRKKGIEAQLFFPKKS